MLFSPIQMEWFYDLEGHKTKLNWFLLEIALEYFDRIRSSKALSTYWEQYDQIQIAQFCAYYARRMKKGLLNCLRGRTKHLIAYQEIIDDFYPHHGDKLNRQLHDTAKEAWDSMLSGCENCSQQCLSDYKSRTRLFEDHEDC